MLHNYYVTTATWLTNTFYNHAKYLNDLRKKIQILDTKQIQHCAGNMVFLEHFSYGYGYGVMWCKDEDILWKFISHDQTYQMKLK